MAKRRQRNRTGRIRGPKGDWEVFIAGGGDTWPSASTLTANTTVRFQMYGLAPANQATNIIPVGSVEVHEVEAHVHVTGLDPAASAGNVAYSSGLYVAEWDDSIPGFHVEAPYGSDMGRENWLEHRASAAFFPTAASATAPIRDASLSFHFRGGVEIHQGESLYFTLSNCVPASSTITYVVFLRARATRVW